jgi:DNA-binding NarL/FixJ family response regulator
MPQVQKLSILIVDDHFLVREGLKQVLGRKYRDIVFGEAGNAEEALAQIKAQPWRLVILDLSLPGRDGFSILEDIRALRPHAVVLVLSMHPDSQYAGRARQLGAAGYISKGSGSSDLLKAVRTVLEGKKYFGESIPLGVENPRSSASPPNLSTQERKVLLALAAGKRSTEIAAELNLSAKTVGAYKRRGFNKLDLQSTADLVRYGKDHLL